MDEAFQKEDGIRLAKRIGALAYVEVNGLAGFTEVAELADVLAWTAHTTGRSENQHRVLSKKIK